MNTEARSSIDNLLSTLRESLAQPGKSLLPLLTSMSRFAKYSLANQMLIFAQRPDATCVQDCGPPVVRDGDPLFVHTEEGPDDMSAHVRVALTQTSLGIPVESGRADLGTWQGVYLWEHRTRAHTRRVTISVVG